MKVFIADDSAVVRERLIDLLSQLAEIEIVGQAEEASEAIDSIRKLKPDTVILDFWTPGGKGIDVLQHIKREERAPVVIILTNHVYPQYRKKCQEEGADFFFDKSTQFDEMTNVLRRLITLERWCPNA